MKCQSEILRNRGFNHWHEWSDFWKEVTAMKYQLIIFDLDGTLMDSIGGIRKAVNMMLERHGYPTFSVEEYFDFVGNGLYNTVVGTLKNTDLTKKEIEPLYEEMLTYYAKHYDYELEPYPGAKNMLEKLNGKVYLAINSNKNDDMVKTITKKYLPEFEFASVWGVKEGQPLKPDPWAISHLMDTLNVKAEQVLFVGDSEVDILTAQNAGVDVCFVTWGFRKKESIVSYEPSYIVDDFSQLYQVIKGEVISER